MSFELTRERGPTALRSPSFSHTHMHAHTHMHTFTKQYLLTTEQDHTDNLTMYIMLKISRAVAGP